MARKLATRYATWLDRHRIGLLAVSVVVALVGGAMARRLPLRSDLGSLLPSSRRSVDDLHQLERRARSFGTIFVVVDSADPEVRARAAAAMSARLQALPPALVAQYSEDDRAIYRYAWDHRFLFADLADLEDARDALQARIDHAKLDANPLYVDLDDEGDDVEAARDRLAALEDKLDEAERKAETPPPRVSRDGRLQLLTVQTAFPAQDIGKARTLLGEVRRAAAAVTHEVSGDFRIRLTGNVTNTLSEHDSILDGMGWSAGVTVLLCAIALLYYYRSGSLVLAMLWALTVGVAATFAGAWMLIGHLDMMSAFLTAIVIGNGINAGLLLVARYLEEVRGGRAPLDAIGPAIGGALPGTLAATATAAVAYTSLLIADFRGFQHFGTIAGLGMVLTWVTTFTVLPAALCVLARRGLVRATPTPALGRALGRLLPRRHLGVVVAIGGLVTVACAAVATRYVVDGPFTKDWRDLQSSTPAIRAGHALDEELRAGFDGATLMSSRAYQVAIAVDRRDQVPGLIARIRSDNAALPADLRWVQDVRGLDDLLPTDQDAKLAVLGQIRALIDDPAVADALDPDERARLDRVRPPDDLRPVGDLDVPPTLAWPFVEKDGSLGRLAILRGSNRLNAYDVADRLEFASRVRHLHLPVGAIVASESLVVADIIASMEHDAPLMVLFALGGSIVAVFMVLGARRHGLVTIACALAGVVVMVAACALVGLRVHFLDLIALPITIGIGADYAVNLAARDREHGERGPHYLLETTGGAVLMCSYTTTVGYASLLLSPNGGIRAFGLAALIGELSCIAMALLVAPSLLAVLRGRAFRVPDAVASDTST